MDEKNVYFVYLDIKPDGEVFYVGKGNEERVRDKERNKWHSSICNKYPDWTRERVFTGSSEDCLSEEMRLIALYGRRDLGLGPLVNLTNGGEGSIGYITPNETRQKISQSMKGKPRKGIPVSEEAKIKISNALKGRPKPPVTSEVRKKISEAKKGKKLSNKHKTNIAKGMAKVKTP